MTMTRHVRRRMLPLSHRDSALSDVVGSMMLLGVTTALVATTAIAIAPHADTPGPVPQLDIALSASVGSLSLDIIHMGGPAIDPTTLRFMVSGNGVVLHDGPLTGGLWEVGGLVSIPLATPLPAGVHVSLGIVDTLSGRTIATSELDVRSSLVSGIVPPPGTFQINMSVAGGVSTLVVRPPAEVLIEARVEHPEGRKLIRFVYFNLSAVQGATWAPLRDDGAGGDRVAGDGIYGLTALIPLNVTSGDVTLTATAIDFRGESTSSSRTLTLTKRLDVTEESLNPTGSPIVDPLAPICPTGKAAISSYRYVIDNTRAVRDMTGEVPQGSTVKAFVTIAPGCIGVPITLASYRAPNSTFSWAAGSQMALSAFDTKTVGAGEHNLTVTVPSCYFQVNLVRGTALATFGPVGTNNYYSTQGRLIDADNGGRVGC